MSDLVSVAQLTKEMRRFLCLLGWHHWGKPVHRIITADSYRYEQVCDRCCKRRVAPRRLWGSVQVTQDIYRGTIMIDVRVIVQDQQSKKFYKIVADDDGRLAFIFIEEKDIRKGDTRISLPPGGMVGIYQGEERLTFSQHARQKS
jgi:hypothetical protein